MFFKTYWILWQNARNLNYIKEFNDNSARKLADSKLKTKEFLSKKWVSVSETILVLSNHEELENFDISVLEPPFVIKPNAGYGWKWIYVIDSIDVEWNFVTNDWVLISKENLITHLSNILDGFFSLSWNRDKVIIERKIIINQEIELLWKFWLPDLRVLVFNKIPVMAMLRVPTSNSWWKANLHAWACWVWIDIWTWKLTYITQFNKTVKTIPWIWDIRGIILPDWDKVLNIAVKVQDITGIWYLWCDIVLDEKQGPILLEVNIRPGLELQLANLSPLEDRLKKVIWVNVTSVEKWVRVWKDLFSWDIEQKIENISWKKIVWTKEYLTLKYNDKTYKYIVDIKVSQNTSYISKEFLLDILKVDEDKIKEWSIRLKTILLGYEKTIKFVIKDLEKVNVILWLNWLKWFLIDPFKYKKGELPINVDLSDLKVEKNTAILKWHNEQLLRIDKSLMDIDKKLLILKFITPKNLLKEKHKFINSKWEYIPQFEYNDINLDLDWFKQIIESIEIPDIPMSAIFLRKKDEILNKINFLISFKNKDHLWIHIYSQRIYGSINKEYLERSISILEDRDQIKEEEEFMTFDEIKAFIKKFKDIYNINISLKEKEMPSRFAMKWDILYIRKGALVWKKEMRSIVAHEIEGHYLRKINWKKSVFSIYWSWTAWYTSVEEWIAIYNQNRSLTKENRKYYTIYERYYFIDVALNKSYYELINELKDFYNNDLEKVFTFMTRLKRWFVDVSKEWCFMKDVVYVNWYFEVLDFLENGWSLIDLYFWKIWINDLNDIKKTNIIRLKIEDYKVPLYFL